LRETWGKKKKKMLRGRKGGNWPPTPKETTKETQQKKKERGICKEAEARKMIKKAGVGAPRASSREDPTRKHRKKGIVTAGVLTQWAERTQRGGKQNREKGLGEGTGKEGGRGKTKGI